MRIATFQVQLKHRMSGNEGPQFQTGSPTCAIETDQKQMTAWLL